MQSIMTKIYALLVTAFTKAVPNITQGIAQFIVQRVVDPICDNIIDDAKKGNLPDELKPHAEAIVALEEKLKTRIDELVTAEMAKLFPTTPPAAGE